MNCNKEELLQKIEELKQQVEQLNNEYPKYMLAYNKLKSNQYIVAFTDKQKGKVVTVVESAIYDVNFSTTKWIPHTDTEVWKEVTNPNELCDKDLVECWNDKNFVGRDLRFYDSKNYCTFHTITRERKWIRYDNYRKLMPWEYPDWAIEAQKLLKD